MVDYVQAFVCGHPINHSRSPMIHNHWIAEHGLSGQYRAIDIAPDDFATFVTTLEGNGFKGGNVTIPHKEAACRLAEKCDEVAELIGAANTLWLEDGQLKATNTDAYGFAANLDERAYGWNHGKTALVLGAGGASRAIILALIDRGFKDIRIINRTVERAVELCDRFGCGTSAHRFEAINELAGDCDLVVNTTSLGLKGQGDIPLDMTRLPAHVLVTDIVYVPLMTPFLAKAAKAGLNTADGLGMLLHQAAPGFEKWFGVRPKVTTELRDLIVADMEKH